jgi:hypothetical protein
LWVKAASIFVSVRFVVSDLGHGNINLFIGLCVVLAAWCLWRRRRFAAGVLVAAAACVKVTPVLWAVYLLYKRQWTALLGFCIGAVVALEIVPLLVLTPHDNHTLLRRWKEHVISSFVKEGKIYSVSMNQSVAGVTNRLLGRTGWAPGAERFALAHLDDDTIKWIQRAIAAAILAALALAARGPLPRGDALAFAAEWSLLAPVTLALSGYTWTGHFCLLVLGIVALLAYFARCDRRNLDRLALALTIIAVCLFVLTTDIITPAGRKWASGMGLPLLGALFVFAALAVVRERGRWRGAPVGMVDLACAGEYPTPPSDDTGSCRNGC